MTTIDVNLEDMPDCKIETLGLEAVGDGTLSICIRNESGDYRFPISAEDVESLLKGSYMSQSDLQRVFLELSIKIQKGEIP